MFIRVIRVNRVIRILYVKITGAIKGIMVFSSFRNISVINLMLIYTLIRIITFIRRNNKCKI